VALTLLRSGPFGASGRQPQAVSFGLGIPTTVVRSRVSSSSTEAYGPDPRGGEPDRDALPNVRTRPTDSTLPAGCLEQCARNLHERLSAWHQIPVREMREIRVKST